jgi:hypothetical protein
MGRDAVRMPLEDSGHGTGDREDEHQSQVRVPGVRVAIRATPGRRTALKGVAR